MVWQGTLMDRDFLSRQRLSEMCLFDSIDSIQTHGCLFSQRFGPHPEVGGFTTRTGRSTPPFVTGLSFA